EGPKVRGVIGGSCLHRGQADLKAGRTTAALADFGRVLALDPANDEARTLVDRVRRRARVFNLARRAAICAAAVGAVILLAVPATRLVKRARAQWESRSAKAVEAAPTATRAPAPPPPAAKEIARADEVAPSGQ